MAENSNIEWTRHTFNPWIGCSKVSPGCANCYAEHLMDHRFGKVKWGDNGNRLVASDMTWVQPEKWNKAAEKAGERHRVFCASLADVFEDRPELTQPRQRLFELIDATPELDWLLLTKRPENISRMMPIRKGREHIFPGMPGPLGEPQPCFISGPRPNVWLGTSVEDQQRADERIPHLLNTPAAVRFLSCEPLLGPVDLRKINWRICDDDSPIQPVHGNTKTIV